jgi:hypothetical protein
MHESLHDINFFALQYVESYYLLPAILVYSITDIQERKDHTGSQRPGLPDLSSYILHKHKYLKRNQIKINI